MFVPTKAARLTAAGALTLAALACAAGPAAAATTIGPGDSGPAVLCVQRAMDLVYPDGPVKTGTYDPQTAAAVVRFQLDHNLPRDGVVGLNTGHAIKVTIDQLIAVVGGSGGDTVPYKGWNAQCRNKIPG